MVNDRHNKQSLDRPAVPEVRRRVSSGEEQTPRKGRQSVGRPPGDDAILADRRLLYATFNEDSTDLASGTHVNQVPIGVVKSCFVKCSNCITFNVAGRRRGPVGFSSTRLSRSHWRGR